MSGESAFADEYESVQIGLTLSATGNVLFYLDNFT